MAHGSSNKFRLSPAAEEGRTESFTEDGSVDGGGGFIVFCRDGSIVDPDRFQKGRSRRNYIFEGIQIFRCRKTWIIEAGKSVIRE